MITFAEYEQAQQVIEDFHKQSVERITAYLKVGQFSELEGLTLTQTPPEFNDELAYCIMIGMNMKADADGMFSVLVEPWNYISENPIYLRIPASVIVGE